VQLERSQRGGGQLLTHWFRVRPAGATPGKTYRKAHPALALYLWLVAITGGRRGELCALQLRDVDLVSGVLHIAFNYVVVGGQRVRKDTKTHQDRHLAIDPVTCAMISEHLDAARRAGRRRP
jgi:integrase